MQLVGERAEVSIEEARARMKVVFAVLGEAVSGGEMDDVRLQFPSEFDPLFE